MYRCQSKPDEDGRWEVVGNWRSVESRRYPVNRAAGSAVLACSAWKGLAGGGAMRTEEIIRRSLYKDKFPPRFLLPARCLTR